MGMLAPATPVSASVLIQAVVVETCGAPVTPLTNGQAGYIQIQRATGNVCTNDPALNAAAIAPIPCRAATTVPASSADGAATAAECDKAGALITNFGAGADLRVSGAANTTAGSATTLIQLAAVTYKIYMTGLQCFRTDAGTSEIYVTLNDTATSVFGIPPVTSGGGFIFTNMASPLVVTAAVSSKTTLQFTVSTGTTTVFCNAQGYYGA